MRLRLVVHLKHLPSFVAPGFTNFPHCRLSIVWLPLPISRAPRLGTDDYDDDDDGIIIMCRRLVHFFPAHTIFLPELVPICPLALLPLPFAAGWVVKLFFSGFPFDIFH